MLYKSRLPQKKANRPSVRPPNFKPAWIELIRNCFGKCKLAEGWALVSEMGNMVRTVAPDFDHRRNGFAKLRDFLTASGMCKFDGCGATLRVCITGAGGDPSAAPSVQRKAIVKRRGGRDRGVADGGPAGGRATRPSTPRLVTESNVRGKSVGWAQFSKPEGDKSPITTGFGVAVAKLKSLALDEDWDFAGAQDPERPFMILRSYLRFTFVKVYRQGDVMEADRYASFNTGLVDKRYEPIYAFFRKAWRRNGPPWDFVDFCFKGQDHEGKELVRNFKPLPQPARYFEDPRSMFYDLSAGPPAMDWDHIIIEHAERLPTAFLEQYAPPGFKVEDVSAWSDTKRAAYLKSFGDAVKEHSASYRAYINRLGDAMDLAIRRVRWNYKTAIPMYYPTKDKMSLLLPLALVSDQTPDVALVVERAESGNYLGHTTLPLATAYNNARLVCRPDSDWLTPKVIHQAGAGLVEEGEGKGTGDDGGEPAGA